jgi:hypothetical protein
MKIFLGKASQYNITTYSQYYIGDVTDMTL